MQASIGGITSPFGNAKPQFVCGEDSLPYHLSVDLHRHVAQKGKRQRLLDDRVKCGRVVWINRDLSEMDRKSNAGEELSDANGFVGPRLHHQLAQQPHRHHLAMQVVFAYRRDSGETLCEPVCSGHATTLKAQSAE